jgi:pimeloyl-ACP methyl ester carboxylesterase
MARSPKKNMRARPKRVKATTRRGAERPALRQPDSAEIIVPQSAIQLPDTAVEEALRTGDQAGPLEDFFGAAGYAELRSLARDASARSVRGGERVLILPGIMGSKLGFPVLGPIEDVLWIGPVQIAAGRLSRLQLSASGDPAGVQALGVLLFAYLALKLRLRIAGYDTQFFPFDWRLDVARIGAKLAQEIDRSRSKTHVVAHSMGGLVARAALKRNPKQLGRVVTLGTPNYGSYSPLQAFRGVHPIVQKVAALDLRHNAAQLAQIFGSFPGLLEMIPASQLRPSDLFDLRNWPNKGVRPDGDLLGAAERAQTALPEPNDKFFLIVGLDNETVVNARLNEHCTEFVYDLSMDGDGTVPLDLARVHGRPAWVTNAAHGSMPNSATVARAIDNILATGSTSELPTLEARLDARPRGAPVRSVRESEIAPPPGAPARTARAVSVQDQRNLVAEFAAAPAAEAPGASLARTIPPAADEAAAREPALLSNFVVTRRQRQRLDIDLVCGSITEIRADAYVVGVFRNVTPDGAAGAIDSELGGALSQLIARRMVSGEAGEITSFPTGRHRLGARSVMLAGLGTIATYTDRSLELIGESIMHTALLTRLDDFAMVPLGAASGSSAGIALEMLLRGFLRAVGTVPDGRLRGFSICELDPARFNELRQTMYRLLRTDVFGTVEVTLNERRLPPLVTRAAAASTIPEAVYLLVREEITEIGAANVVASVLTAGGKAAIVQSRQPLDDRVMDNLAKQLAKTGVSADRMDQFGSQLAEMVLPPEIRDVLAQETGTANGGPVRPLVIVHDAPMSRVPWETLRIGNAAPALKGGLTHRYDGGVLSVAKWREEGPKTPGLNVLLVINPTGDLPDAEKEGKRIEGLFKQMPGVRMMILPGKQASHRELLRLFQSGEFDVVHYAGHAFFDPHDRARSGIICNGGEVLSGADLASLAKLPSLVFFNACEAARVRRPGAREEGIKEPTRGTIGFAESFLAGGVANYLGTYWPVNDAAAEAFASAFYTALLGGTAIGSSLIKGREAVHAEGLGDWADYVLYGNERFKLALNPGDKS